MGLFSTKPSPEGVYRKSLRDKFISKQDVDEAWRTTLTAMNIAAQEESATKARDMELKALERAEAAKKKREDNLKRS